jgi:hypothetical protein
MKNSEQRRVKEILALVRPLAAEYYQLTKKPLGVTGEIAEYFAAELLGLTLVPARTAGYDALRGSERIQIKGRACEKRSRRSQHISRIKTDANCDVVLLVLLDNTTLEPHEIWEASYDAVVKCLSRPGSKARERGSLGVSTFKSISKCIWPKASQTKSGRKCPECGQVFVKSFAGIDGHWRAKHGTIIAYEKARPFILSGRYSRIGL